MTDQTGETRAQAAQEAIYAAAGLASNGYSPGEIADDTRALALRLMELDEQVMLLNGMVVLLAVAVILALLRLRSARS